MVLVVAVLMLTVVTIIGIAALTTSDTELQVSANEKLLAWQFYDVEAAQIDTWETRTTWMTTSFLIGDQKTTSYASTFDTDADGTDDATVDIRYIQDESAAVAAANNLPVQRHIGPPPTGSGYSIKYFEARKYGIRATSQTGNTQVQTGVFMVFNKF
jgi:Tfp pilus assembly protein PilX